MRYFAHWAVTLAACIALLHFKHDGFAIVVLIFGFMSMPDSGKK